MRKNSGAILVLTLAVLTGVVAVMASIAAIQRLAFRAETNRLQTMRADMAARSGIQRALTTIAAQNVNHTSHNDDWYTLGNNGDDRFMLDNGSFRMQVLDAGSLVNLNSATQPQLLNLPLTQEQVDSLLDWRSTGNQARPLGAKDDFYSGLPKPYLTAQRGLLSVDELLLIKNFTPAAIFLPQQGVSTQTQVNSPTGSTNQTQPSTPVLYDLVTVDSASSNSNAQGQAKLNVANATAQQLMQRARLPRRAADQIFQNRRTLTSLQAVLRFVTTNQEAANVLDNLTVGTSAPTGKININTAPQSVLSTIPNLTSDIAQGIISRQANTGFATLGEITQVPGMTLQVLRQTADQFTISSHAFVVRVIGTAGDASVPLEAVVTLSNNTARVTRISKPPYNNMIPYWHWQSAATNDVDFSTGAQ